LNFYEIYIFQKKLVGGRISLGKNIEGVGGGEYLKLPFLPKLM
jgi:hypothetical protein